MKRTLGILTIGILALVAMKAGAQGMAVNTTGAGPNSSAMFDVASTTKGMLLPRMNSAQMAAIASPATGLLVYCSDCSTVGFQYYTGSTWTPLSAPAAPAPLSVTSTTSATYIAGISDNYITYNGSGLSFTVTLPSTTTSGITTGHVYYIKFNSSNSGLTYTNGHFSVTAAAGDQIMLFPTGSAGPLGYTTGTQDLYATGLFTSVGLVCDAVNHQWNLLYVSY